MAEQKIALECLLDVCKRMRDSSGYNKRLYKHEITQTEWKSFCKQIKEAEKVLKYD